MYVLFWCFQQEVRPDNKDLNYEEFVVLYRNLMFIPDVSQINCLNMHTLMQMQQIKRLFLLLYIGIIKPARQVTLKLRHNRHVSLSLCILSLCLCMSVSLFMLTSVCAFASVFLYVFLCVSLS